MRGEALAAAGLDATAVRRGGWTAADVRRLLQASAAQPVVAVPDDGWDALLDLVAAGASLEQAAAWLVDLRGARRLLVAAAGPQGEGGLEAWRTGRAAMVAGPSPFLAAELARRGAELVPAPRLDSGGAASAAQPFIRADVGGVLVFRQKSYRGDDHTRAAVELARAFSRQSIPWADAAGPVYPAARQGRDERGRPLPSLPAWLAPHLRAGPLPTVEAAATAARRRQEQVGPALAAFWARRADPAELARALERLAAESR
ncbi:MAG: hypothetical protein IRY95_09610 [Clostridia bacterium]|nr:hypothetical protein [Clostridia bacterium]